MPFNGAGFASKIKYLVEKKLLIANASSIDTAVTPDEAKLDFSESQWLMYLSGGMSSNIRKTLDNRYYLRKTR
jgi:hypothetical protein